MNGLLFFWAARRLHNRSHAAAVDQAPPDASAPQQGQAGVLVLVVLALILGMVVTAGVVTRLLAGGDSLQDARRDLRERWTARSAAAYVLALYQAGELGGATRVPVPALNGIQPEVSVEYQNAPIEATVAQLTLGPPHSQGRPHLDSLYLPCGRGSQVNLQAWDAEGQPVFVPLDRVVWADDLSEIPDWDPNPPGPGSWDDAVVLVPDAQGFWQAPAAPVLGLMKAVGYEENGAVVPFDEANTVEIGVSCLDADTVTGQGLKQRDVTILPHIGAVAVGQGQHLFAFALEKEGGKRYTVVDLTPTNASLTVTPDDPALVEVVEHPDHWELRALGEGSVTVEIGYTGARRMAGEATFDFFIPPAGAGEGEATITATAGGVTAQFQVYLEGGEVEVLGAGYTP